jgi:hypothetical protein
VLDALTYADQTIGPHCQPMTIDTRLHDMLHRHGPYSVNAQVHPQRGPYHRAADRVHARLDA